ncbi:MAG: helix-turn-helix domain-containing protein [Candidatus Moranbacteria bacterium]|nr:helix-turn-helix domain-containing protein [Candidatus Moranbacteria bacterium]
MQTEDLKNAGLSQNEAKVYLAALELGETSIYRLAKKSGVKRTTTYLAVETLKEKGLISSYERDNTLVVYAENPKKLTDQLEERKRALEKIMPELLAFTNLIDKKPKIRYFEGKEAYKEVFGDVLNYPDSETLVTFNEKFWDWDGYFKTYFMPKRKEKKIWARILFRDTPELRAVGAQAEEYLSRAKFVPSENFKIGIEMVLYGRDKVGMVSYEEEIAIIIESKMIYDTQKSFFEVIWEGAK